MDDAKRVHENLKKLLREDIEIARDALSKILVDVFLDA